MMAFEKFTRGDVSHRRTNRMLSLSRPIVLSSEPPPSFESGFYADGPETPQRLVYRRESPVTILYVEDDLTDIYLLNHAIEDAGDSVRLVAFRDPADALLVCHHTDVAPDLVIIDINMPRIGGLELLKKLKKLPLFAGVPFVTFTTSPGPRYREEAANLGATHIVKPMVYDDYPRVAARILELARHRPNS